jgi:tetratricopeptide (TPR) repeat protein
VDDLTQTVERTRLEHSEEGIEARMAQAAVYLHSQRTPEAEVLYRSILQDLRNAGKGQSEVALRCWNNLGLSIGWQGRWKEAGEQYQELHAVDRRVYGEDHPYTMMTLMELGTTMLQQQRFDEAEEAMRGALVIARRIFLPAHPTLLICMNNLGSLLLDRGKLDEAEAILMEGYETGRQKLRPMDAPMDTLVLHLAKLRNRQKRFSEAADYSLQLHDAVAAKYGPRDKRTLSTLVYVYQNLLYAGRGGEGLAMIEQLGELPADPGPVMLQSLYGWSGQLYLASGNLPAAQRHYQLGSAAAINSGRTKAQFASALRELGNNLGDSIPASTQP